MAPTWATPGLLQSVPTILHSNSIIEALLTRYPFYTCNAGIATAHLSLAKLTLLGLEVNSGFLKMSSEKQEEYLSWSLALNQNILCLLK